ncbi:MAG: tetratricopeptide repeat protein [Steroidobacteraceae bacterium]
MSRAQVVSLALVLALAAGAADAAKPRKSETIGDLQRKAVDVRTTQPVPSSSGKAMENYRRFLELQQTDPQLRAEALRRLGDLNLESGELERMSSEVTSLDMQGAAAIELYTTLLKAYPDYPRNDQVLYQLARAYETTGQPERALATLDSIVKQYPQSRERDEVEFRRGELLFSAKQYRDAERAYRFVVDAGDKSAFYAQSLYKHGWSLFKQGLNEDSLPSFVGVLDKYLRDPKDPGRAVKMDSLSRADRELTEDTLRVMSITFSYLDGPSSLDEFVAGRGNAPYSYLLYSRLGDLYVEKERYQDAAGAYRAFVGRDPNNENAPGLSMQAIEAYRKGGFAQLVLDGKREYVERYNFAAPFWQGRERADYPTVVGELKINLKDVAQHFHGTAQKSGKLDDYMQAARWYRSYLESFPDDPDSAATNYLLAETLFESKQFADAAAEYERTAYKYPKNDRSAQAAYAGLVSYQKLEESLPAQSRGEWHTRAVDAGVRFAETFPEHPDSAGVLTRAAEDVFASNDFPRAIGLANKLLARQPPVETAKQRIAWTIIGQSNFDLKQYGEAETGFQRARDLVPPDDPMRKDLTERLAASVYRQGEALQQGGDADGAVDAFLRVARVAPDSSIRPTAEYDAAAQLIKGEQWDRAITVLEGFRNNFPKHELVRDATRNLAVAYSKTGRAGQAAMEFERMALDTNEDAAVRREATMTAADLYEQAKNSAKATAMLERFVAEYPQPVAEAIEARQRLATIASGSGNTERQRYWFAQIIKSDREAGAGRTDRTRFLAAKAQLALAEPDRDAFRAIKLTIPLKKSLASKRKALETALAAYKTAADYRIAEVTTAATFEMAELYRGLGRDLMASERPKGLSADELEQYDLLLEEQAFPFEEQAIEMHEVNTARIADGVYDASVQQSFVALAKLKPARYGKTEQSYAVISQLSRAARPADPAQPDAPPDIVPPPPPQAQTDFERALAALASGNDVEAELQLKQMTVAYPDLPGPWFNLGLLLRKLQRFDEALAAFAEGARRDPRSVAGLTEMGVTARLAGKFADARRAYEQALALDENDAALQRNYGVLLDLYMNEPVLALAAFRKYQQLAPEDKQVAGWIADLERRAGGAGPSQTNGGG